MFVYISDDYLSCLEADLQRHTDQSFVDGARYVLDMLQKHQVNTDIENHAKLADDFGIYLHG